MQLQLFTTLLLSPLMYLGGTFAARPVLERVSGTHHMQLLSGCPPVIFWAGSYVSLANVTLPLVL